MPEWAVDLEGFTPAEICLLIACRNAAYTYGDFKKLWDKSQRSIIGKKEVKEEFYTSLLLKDASPDISAYGWISFMRYLEKVAGGN